MLMEVTPEGFAYFRGYSAVGRLHTWFHTYLAEVVARRLPDVDFVAFVMFDSNIEVDIVDPLGSAMFIGVLGSEGEYKKVGGGQYQLYRKLRYFLTVKGEVDARHWGVGYHEGFLCAAVGLSHEGDDWRTAEQCVDAFIDVLEGITKEITGVLEEWPLIADDSGPGSEVVATTL